MDEPTDAQPAFVVVRGRPDSAELAALTAVLLTRLRTAHAEAPSEADGAAARAGWDAPRRRRPRVGWTAPR
ncbi:acyl-CoA carboxylase subunit epsilon [Streptomyces sp. NPDC052676]|uniref:acyl-CoA carboxylase subunit epsilon n=1 Tax=Streptomyces sp. NPDC052676 TaxID=3154953 RepID=UPI00342284B4